MLDKQAKNCLFIKKSAEIPPWKIRSFLDYDRSHCAEASYLRNCKRRYISLNDQCKCIIVTSSQDKVLPIPLKRLKVDCLVYYKGRVFRLRLSDLKFQ